MLSDDQTGAGRWDILALGLLFLLPLLKFAKVALGQSVFAGADHSWINIPLRAISGEAFRQGDIPLWNKALSCGTPHLAQTEAGVFYPGNLLLYLPLDFLRAYDWTLLLHFVALGWAFYFLARFFGGRLRSSVTLAALLVLSPFVLFNLSTSNFFQTFWLVPVSFIAWEWARRGSPLPAGALAGLALGLNLLAGRPELVVYTWAGLGVVGLTYLLGTHEPGRWPRLILFFGTALALGIGLAAVQLQATFGFLPQSTRGGEVAAGFGAYGAWLTPARLFSVLLFPTIPKEAADYNFYHLANPFLGAAPLVLILMALPVLWRDRDRARPLMFGGIAVLVLALAPSLPLVRLILEIPPFSRLRYPGRAVPVFLCLAGVLAVLAWELLEASGISGRMILVPVLVVAAGLGLFAVQSELYVSPIVPVGQCLLQLAPLLLLAVPAMRKGWEKSFSGAAVVACLFQLAPLFLWYGNFGSPRPFFEKAFSLVQPISTAESTERRVLVSVLPFLKGGKGAVPGGSASEAWWRQYPPFLGNGALLKGAHVVNEYNHFAWKDWYTFELEGLGNAAAGESEFPASGVSDLVGLKWLLVPDRPPPPDGEWQRVAGGDPGEFSLWRRISGPGLASLATSLVRMAGPGPEKLAALAQDGSIDFRSQVVIGDPSAPSLPADSGLGPGVIEQSPAGSHAFSFQVTTPQAAYLVLRDHDAPGWQAVLDGKEVPCYRANGFFKAVFVPPGSHRIDFVYRPAGFTTSLAISALSALAALALLANPLFGRRRT